MTSIVRSSKFVTFDVKIPYFHILFIVLQLCIMAELIIQLKKLWSRLNISIHCSEFVILFWIFHRFIKGKFAAIYFAPLKGEFPLIE